MEYDSGVTDEYHWVRRLDLVNYRGFERLELDFERDVTVLVGVNGSGKTSVLDALIALVPQWGSPLTDRDVRVGAKVAQGNLELAPSERSFGFRMELGRQPVYGAPAGPVPPWSVLCFPAERGARDETPGTTKARVWTEEDGLNSWSSLPLTYDDLFHWFRSARTSRTSESPSAFRKWVRDHPADTPWDEFLGDPKAALRTRLHTDQSGLCCYCSRRVQDDRTSHIEHIEAQTDANRYDWDNLALACDGGNASRGANHCDHAKADKPLQYLHPYRRPVHRHARMKTSGVLRFAADAEADAELLKLNWAPLRRARQAAIRAATADLGGSRRPGQWRPHRVAQ